MKKLLILSFVLFAISGKSFAYYSYDQIKYEQSIGSHETLDRVMENPKQAEKMYYQHMNEKNDYIRGKKDIRTQTVKFIPDGKGGYSPGEIIPTN